MFLKVYNDTIQFVFPESLLIIMDVCLPCLHVCSNYNDIKCPSGAMDSASDFGSGGWGFESLLGLFFKNNFLDNEI